MEFICDGRLVSENSGAFAQWHKRHRQSKSSQYHRCVDRLLYPYNNPNVLCLTIICTNYRCDMF
jgi:hypothetical protein